MVFQYYMVWHYGLYSYVISFDFLSLFICQRASLKSIDLHWNAWVVMVCFHMFAWMLKRAAWSATCSVPELKVWQPDARFACWSLETARLSPDLSSYVGCIHGIHMPWQGVFIHIYTIIYIYVLKWIIRNIITNLIPLSFFLLPLPPFATFPL